jgi:hypothetical protein
LFLALENIEKEIGKEYLKSCILEMMNNSKSFETQNNVKNIGLVTSILI